MRWRSSGVIAALGSLWAACDASVSLPFPTKTGEESLLLFVVRDGQVAPFAVDLLEEPRMLTLPTGFSEGSAAQLYGLGFRRTLSELGLLAGPFESAADPSAALEPDSISVASFDGATLSSWSPSDALPAELQRLRLPLANGCTRFTARRLTELDGLDPLGLLAVGDVVLVTDGSHLVAVDDQGVVRGRISASPPIQAMAVGPSGVWAAKTFQRIVLIAPVGDSLVIGGYDTAVLPT